MPLAHAVPALSSLNSVLFPESSLLDFSSAALALTFGWRWMQRGGRSRLATVSDRKGDPEASLPPGLPPG